MSASPSNGTSISDVARDNESSALRMPFVSTRGGSKATSIDDALLAGLAPDGGLYVPAQIPQLDAQTLAAIGTGSLAQTAAAVLKPYFVDSRLRDSLSELCSRAYNFDAPLLAMTGAQDSVLELFHGPTAAFKDYAARFLAECLAGLSDSDDDALADALSDARDVTKSGAPGRTLRPTTILVATSGDTGAAVAGAFHRRPGFAVTILYPHGRVSPRQAHGLECWGDNIRTFRVDGTFDDCQRMAKAVLADTELRAACALTSANSISLGRLLPQVAYYAHTAGAFFAKHGQALNLIVPTGNLGNAAAAYLGKRMGLPIGDIILATNANDVLPRFFDGGDYAPHATIATLANAMDVGAPSNFERLRHWHRDNAELRTAMRAYTVDDATIRTTLAAAPTQHGIVACPHTACGLHVLERLRTNGDTRPWTVVATAHPAKFDSIVEPLIGDTVSLPPALADCLARPAHGEHLAASDTALRAKIIASA
jgi:threonine synthase